MRAVLVVRGAIDDLTLEHGADRFECLRSRRAPHCTVGEGFVHSAACIMAARALSARQATSSIAE